MFVCERCEWNNPKFLQCVKPSPSLLCLNEHVIGAWDGTLPTAEILTGINAHAWVSMVLYKKKKLKLKY